MHKLLQILLFILFSIPVPAQRLSGRVIDSKSGLPVSYASIGLIKGNVGTNADEDGRFIINTTLNLINDSLIISSVGYKPVKIPLQNEKSVYEVFLDKKDVVLREVVVRKLFRKITLPWNKGRSDLSHTTMGINTQCARLLTAPIALSQLKAVTVAFRKGMFIQEKDSRFRIRIYDYDSVQKKPGIEICDSVIEVEGGGIITVNLEKYQITLPQKRFFVAIQWLFIDENKEPVMNPDGKTIAYHTYRPSIRMKRTKENEGNTWMQMHNQQWDRFNFDSSITATVLY